MTGCARFHAPGQCEGYAKAKAEVLARPKGRRTARVVFSPFPPPGQCLHLSAPWGACKCGDRSCELARKVVSRADCEACPLSAGD